MTKRRASISGRGAEILFGEPPAVELEPRAPGPAPGRAENEGQAAIPPAEPDLPPPPPGGEGQALDDEEMLRALLEEARGGQVLPGEEAPSPVAAVEAGADPAAEVALIREAFAAEAPPEPVAEIPTPTMEETMEERERAAETAMNEPPPPEVSDLTEGILPPKPRRPMVLEFEPGLARDIQEPDHEIKPIELPNRTVSEEERQAVLKWWGNRRVRELSDEIDSTYQEVRRKVGENEVVATEAYNLLLKARDIVLFREVERMAQAEYYVELVQARLKRATESEAAAKKAQWPLLAWGLLWGVAFLALLVATGTDWFQRFFQTASKGQSIIEMDVFVSAMLWGGIGGAVAVLYSLFKHVGERDFDPQYVISYVGKPFMGLIVGATVYMILALVVRALGIVPAGAGGTETGAAPTIAPGVVYLMAWAAGFKENRLLELVDRVMKQVFGSQDKEEPAPGPAPTAPSPPSS